MKKKQFNAAQMFCTFPGERELLPSLPVAKTNARNQSISVWCPGRVSIHTADVLRCRHPAFVAQRRDNAYELSQRLDGYHDDGGQTLGAGNAVYMQCGY